MICSQANSTRNARPAVIRILVEALIRQNSGMPIALNLRGVKTHIFPMKTPCQSPLFYAPLLWLFNREMRPFQCLDEALIPRQTAPILCHDVITIQ